MVGIVLMASNIALIGSGYFGSNYRRIIDNREDLSLGYVCDLSINEGVRGDTKLIKDYRQILDDGNIDSVIVATPTNTHYKIVADILNSGKNVLAEKPLAYTSEQVQNLIDLSNSNKKKLMVGHVFLHNPAIQFLGDSIKEGELGNVLYMNSRRLSYNIIREKDRKEDALWDLGLHDISMFLYLSPSSPKSVNVFAKSLSEVSGNLEDLVKLNMEFEDSSSCHLNASWAYPKKVRELVVVGDRKMAIFDDTAKNKLTFFDININTSDDDFFKRDVGTFTPELPSISPLEAQINHFVKCVKEDLTPLTDGYNALKVIETLEYASDSMKNNGKEVLIRQNA